jgi:beta-N-acetylglucosaminidase/uncharacterized protein YgiM (DUF1202 family)
MLSKKTRMALVKAGVALTVTMTSIGAGSLSGGEMALAAVINTQTGTLTVKAASLWAYSSPNWSAKSRTYPAGTSLKVVEKHEVDGRYMYKLENGLYISANTVYVTFSPDTASVPAPVPSPAPAEQTGDVRVTTANLNMRSGPGTGYSIITTIPKGGSVRVASVSGGWAKVTYGGRTGYVSTSYLSAPVTAPAPAPAPTPAPESPSGDVRKTTANLNMRSGPGTGYSILMTIPNGSSVTVSSVSGGWAKVTYGGKTGYVSTSYLTQPVTSTPAPAPVTPSQDTRTTLYNLNMRSGPGTGYSILVTIPKGTSIPVASVSGGWAKVTYGGRTGYVSTAYLSEPQAPAVKPDLPMMLTIEASPKESYSNEDIVIKGWALDDSGIKDVTILLDGVQIGTASRYSRSDVENVYTSYESRANSGFEFMIPKSGVSIGTHTVTVRATGIDGTVKENTYTTVMVKESPVVTVTSHESGAAVRTEKTTIEGFALNVDGVAQVSVELNGAKIGNAVIGLARTGMEAHAAYSDPSNSGFSFTFDTKSMAQGNNTIKLVMTGRDGTLKSETITLVSNEFYVEKAYSETLTYYAKAELAKGSAIKQVDGKWIAATVDDIRYYIDPANFMNDYIGKYMFMKLSYIEVDNAVLEQMLEGKGILSGKAQVFKDACKTNNINPIYVIAHALLETGNGTSVLANGVEVKEKHVVFNDLYSPVIPVDPPVTVYNMFGIGAYDGNAVLWGSERALDRGWTTPDLAIAGGVKFLAESYINNSTYMQNTLYTMRYRFEGYGLWHQYSTDIAWHYKQARIIQREFAKIPNLPRFEFEIPTFKEELPQQ